MTTLPAVGLKRPAMILMVVVFPAPFGPRKPWIWPGPTSMETPSWETDKTVTPSPHHPFGAKGVGESATVGAPPAIVNAVVDALSHLGVKHVEIPMTPERVWRILKEKGVAL